MSARVVAVCVAAAALVSGCTLTAAGSYEAEQVADLVYSLDPDVVGAVDVPCADVPWLGAELADQSIRCLSVELDDGQVEETARTLADRAAAAAGGEARGTACGTAAGVTVQCAGFASVPEARDQNLEIWVSLSDADVAELPPGQSAGRYWVTYRLVPYGPDVYRSEDPTEPAG